MDSSKGNPAKGALVVLIALACCGGCMTQTVTRKPGYGASQDSIVRSRTVWIWQKDFWSAGDSGHR